MRVLNQSRRVAVGAIAVGAVVTGFAAPAFAGAWSTSINKKPNGWSSSSWKDHDSDDLTKVQFGTCTRDFQARIRAEKPLWDSTVASEWIDCTSYVDSVVTKAKVPVEDYHFDIDGMGQQWCGMGSCVSNVTTVKNVKVTW